MRTIASASEWVDFQALSEQAYRIASAIMWNIFNSMYWQTEREKFQQKTMRIIFNRVHLLLMFFSLAENVFMNILQPKLLKQWK